MISNVLDDGHAFVEGATDIEHSHALQGCAVLLSNPSILLVISVVLEDVANISLYGIVGLSTVSYPIARMAIIFFRDKINLETVSYSTTRPLILRTKEWF